MELAVFFDMDGILSDFVRGALAHHNRSDFPVENIQWGIEAQLGITPHEFWAGMGHQFWQCLPVYNDGFGLLSGVAHMVTPARIGLLTSPCDTAGCIDGKRAWVQTHLPEYRRRTFTGSAKELFAGPSKVLIDDHDDNCAKFVAAGGIAVTPPRPWNRRRDECLPGGYFEPLRVFAEVKLAIETAIVRTHPRAAG
jgi:hypothetical protein